MEIINSVTESNQDVHRVESSLRYMNTTAYGVRLNIARNLKDYFPHYIKKIEIIRTSEAKLNLAIEYKENLSIIKNSVIEIPESLNFLDIKDILYEKYIFDRLDFLLLLSPDDMIAYTTKHDLGKALLSCKPTEYISTIYKSGGYSGVLYNATGEFQNHKSLMKKYMKTFSKKFESIILSKHQEYQDKYELRKAWLEALYEEIEFVEVFS